MVRNANDDERNANDDERNANEDERNANEFITGRTAVHMRGEAESPT